MNFSIENWEEFIKSISDYAIDKGSVNLSRIKIAYRDLKYGINCGYPICCVVWFCFQVLKGYDSVAARAHFLRIKSQQDYEYARNFDDRRFHVECPRCHKYFKRVYYKKEIDPLWEEKDG